MRAWQQVHFYSQYVALVITRTSIALLRLQLASYHYIQVQAE